LQILGDNPLVPSELIDDVVRFHQDQDLDYAVSATTEFPGLGNEVSKFPIGVRVEVIRASTLMRCHGEARTPDEREHSLSYVYTHPEDFRVGHFPAVGPWAGVARPELSFAVNYGTNLELVSRIFELCHPTDPNFPLSAAVEAFDAHPELHPLMGTPVEA
jgi:spore coat polysaccharide biosynthesis protein SpsF (cytidylyltransferase family)